MVVRTEAVSAGLTCKVNVDVLVLAKLSVALILKTVEPIEEVGVPEIAPVLVFKVKPVGSGVPVIA